MNIKSTIMNAEEIRRLLERYYAGESSLDDEVSLKEFFSREYVPEDLMEEKEIFRYYLQSSDVPEPSAGFENSIFSALDAEDRKYESLKRRRIFGAVSGIAAALLILTGTYFFFINKSQPKDTYSDPEIAYAETMKILYDVSDRLNRGTRSLGYLNRLQNETMRGIETVNRTATIMKEKMEPLNTMLETFEEINSTNH